jgi:hypothetical protein
MDWKKFKNRVSHSATEILRRSNEIANGVVDSKASERAQDVAIGFRDNGVQVASQTKEWAKQQYTKATEPLNAKNWYIRAAKSCESVADALLRENSGTSSKISKSVVAKLGAFSTATGIFSLASLVGTASTGTAIGTLSGAAFNSAALAWLGGSVAMGSFIIGVAALAGGAGAVFGMGWVTQKYFWGQKRERSELEEQEKRVLDACLALSAAFREKYQLDGSIDSISAKILHDEALTPLSDELLTICNQVDDWQLLARKRLWAAVNKLLEIKRFLEDWAAINSSITTGVVGAVVIRLLAGDLNSFNEHEEMVLEAMRRLKRDLSDATNEELAAYVQGMEPEQLQGLQNNVKGIYHEIRFAHNENTDGDEYIAELFLETNHPGADVRLVHLETGEVRELQLKATNYISSIREHNEKYASTDIFATSEVSAMHDSVISSGFSNEELTEDTEQVFDNLNAYSDDNVASSMAVAGVITLSRNIRVLLKGDKISQTEKHDLVKGGVVFAGVAGIMSLVLG